MYIVSIISLVFLLVYSGTTFSMLTVIQDNNKKISLNFPAALSVHVTEQTTLPPTKHVLWYYLKDVRGQTLLISYDPSFTMKFTKKEIEKYQAEWIGITKSILPQSLSSLSLKQIETIKKLFNDLIKKIDFAAAHSIIYTEDAERQICFNITLKSLLTLLPHTPRTTTPRQRFALHYINTTRSVMDPTSPFDRTPIFQDRYFSSL